MKENVFDVLIYLFERFMEGDADGETDVDAVRVDLLEAGFPSAEITKALDWLDALTDKHHVSLTSPPLIQNFLCQRVGTPRY